MKQHPGLEALARHMSRKVGGVAHARAILAAAARRASPAAKRANPRLRRVK